MSDGITQVDKLNFSLYMYNRTKAYDFTKSKEIRECLKMSVCALYDYIRHEKEVHLLREEFDASIELHDPVTWMSIENDNPSGDSMVRRTIRSIKETADLFKELKLREERVCKVLLSKILQMEADVRVFVLGEDFLFPPDNIKEYIDRMFRDLQEPPVQSDSEEIYTFFIENVALKNFEI